MILAKKFHYIFALMLLALLAVACSSEKAIKKGDQYAAVLEYHEAAKEYKKAYSKIPSKGKLLILMISLFLVQPLLS